MDPRSFPVRRDPSRGAGKSIDACAAACDRAANGGPARGGKPCSGTPWTLAVAALVLAGCSTADGPDRRTIALGDFAAPPADLRTDVVAASPSLLTPPTVVVDGETTEEIGPDGASRGETREVVAIESRRADGSVEVDAVSPEIVAEQVAAGEVWPVEGLVGQINGRPLFASAFFEPISDRLVQAAGMRDRVEGRRAFVEIVRREFKLVVDNELVIAEAESQLTVEQQQGLLGWLRTVQEQTIAQRGGTRAEAEASLEREEGTGSIEEYLQRERDVGLARKLLNERTEPRTIVSWRDIVQEYERRSAEFNPPPSIRIGRIRLGTATDAERIERVKALVAEGRTFPEIATLLELPEGGLWNTFALPPEGIRGLQLADAVKERLDGLAEGVVSAPLEQRDFVIWLSVLEIVRPPARSVYDREVQLQLQAELRARRMLIERERFIDTLRSRWVSDDIGEMEGRLVEMALARYWR
jgi:hypothetical protein